MEIILIRHEKAEALQEGKTDRERHLTDSGVLAMQAVVPALKAHLGTAPVLLWMSPAVRARETATVIIEALDLEPATEHDFIYTGEFAKFEAALVDLDVSDDAKLLIFGHEPTLSDWIHKLTGEHVKMKKGDMASLYLTSESPFTANYSGKI